MLMNAIFHVVSLVLSLWGTLIILIFISNRSMKKVLLETSGLIKNIQFEQITFKKPRQSYLLIKRLIDLCICVLLLPLLLPLFLLVGILIKIDSYGPILQTTRRTRLNGQTYNAFTFRTMFAHEDAKHYEPAHIFGLSSSSKVTKVGHLLRTTSLDQIPLTINILRGDMTLVGSCQIRDSSNVPTVITPQMYNDLATIKPGIVSLWSISYDKIEHNYQNRSLYDLVYASRMSFLFDMKILLSTVAIVFGKFSLM